MKLQSWQTICFLLSLLMLTVFMQSNVNCQEIIWNTNPTPLPIPVREHMAAVHNGRIYVIGGGIGEGVVVPDVYFGEVDPHGTIDAWSSTAPLPEWRIDATAVVLNDFIYVIGGMGPVWRGRNQQNTVFYAAINADGTIDNWIADPTLLPERISHHASIVSNGIIYLLGGTNGYRDIDEIYYANMNPDGSTSEWLTNPTPLPLAYSTMGAVVHDDMIYLIGGFNGPFGTPQNLVFYALINTDGTVGEWNSGTSLPVSISSARAALIDNSIYVVGGMGGSDNAEAFEAVYNAQIESHGAMGEWVKLSSLPEPRATHTLVEVQGRIYAVCGKDRVNDEWMPKDTIYYSSSTCVAMELNVDPTL